MKMTMLQQFLAHVSIMGSETLELFDNSIDDMDLPNEADNI